MRASWNPRTHRPVGLVFYAGLARMHALVIDEIPKLPSIQAANPVNQAAFSWTGMQAMARSALDMAVNATPRVVMAAADGLYAALVDHIEEELMVATDTVIPRARQGKRGRGPQLV